ncbi:hypothetical protein LXL04_020541 [Taraxacum kok-saghyz]
MFEYVSETDQSVDQYIPNSNRDIVVDQFPSKSSSSSDSGFFEERLYSEGEFSSIEIKSADGSKTEFWRPNVPEPILPRKDMIFENLQKGIDFYTKYARRAGFDTRLGSEKIVNSKKCYKYVICSRSGKAEESSSNSLKVKQKRKYPSQMMDCRAKIGFKVIDDTGRWFVNSFEPVHNHELYTKSTVHMSRSMRQLDHYDKTLIWQLNKANVGAVQAHGIVTGFKGGVDKQGAKKVNYKNFARDLNCYMKDTDASLMFNLLENRADSIPGFSFYHLLEGSELRGVFWADSIAKRNYKEFSDVISFDATYRTNKYNLVFVPFMGIDNHQRCVTFGAALMARETEEYYIWLLESFLNAFGKQPNVVVTDQDAAVGNAVQKVFTQSKHRLCMWHIGKKLTVYLTTNLVMFICKFDAAMDKQRSIQSASDFTSVSKLPPISTRLEFENQASRFYTHKMFGIFQKEVHDCVWSCSVVNCTSVYDHDSFLVLEQVMGEFGENKSVFFNVKSNNFRSHNRSQFQYQVTFHQSEDMFRCKCMVFEHLGFLCRHILSVMKAKFISEIPSKYFIRRWQKGVIRSQELEKTYSFGGDIGGCQGMIEDAYRVVADSVNMIAHDPDSMTLFLQWQKEIRNKIEANPPNKDSRTKDELIASMIGISKVDKITIRNPKIVKFKGCGTGGKRLQGRREISMNSSKKDGRTCTYCNKKIAPGEKHDRRNCPVRKEDERKNLYVISVSPAIEGGQPKVNDPLELTATYLDNNKGLNSKFSLSWCQRALPIAKDVYLHELPPCYPISQHESHLSKALTFFKSMVKGPAVELYLKKLET